METKKDNLEVAYRHVLFKLESTGYKVSFVENLNRNRYILVKGIPYNCLIMYKRELFFSFGKMFEKEGEKGVGDTINCDDLKTAIQNNVKYIFTIFPDEKIYYIEINDFLINSHKWKNKEGKEVRSISIHKYDRYPPESKHTSSET